MMSSKHATNVRQSKTGDEAVIFWAASQAHHLYKPRWRDASSATAKFLPLRSSPLLPRAWDFHIYIPWR